MNNPINQRESRRRFIKSGALLGAAALLGPARVLAAEQGETKTAEVTPTEDLMKEHGVLRRLLLIYDDMGTRLKEGREAPAEVLKEAIGLIRRFVEYYHEKDEEEYLFTRFNKAGKLVDLVQVLYAQHQAGRQVTTRIEEKLIPARFSQAAERAQLAAYLRAYTRMYRAHAAREDTVLYPAFRSVISPRDFMALGDLFEAKEVKLFGKDGFEKIVIQVADLEKRLGIYELAQFTPKA
ncbi:MAG: hemerythrin domain-containing protein [Syntrophobacterales bacterium]|jgi:hemerythrin-like domain-containing protein|nr:hemerythrin domain-containing protein [Syntrophobacterales bacterium]